MLYLLNKAKTIWVNLGGPWNGKGWYILLPLGIPIYRPFGKYYGHLVIYIVVICIVSPFWYIVSRKIKKNLATQV
jgi:hypothetical protein